MNEIANTTERDILIIDRLDSALLIKTVIVLAAIYGKPF